jgi:hypothetical protein
MFFGIWIEFVVKHMQYVCTSGIGIEPVNNKLWHQSSAMELKSSGAKLFNGLLNPSPFYIKPATLKLCNCVHNNELDKNVS